jgi:hypothetical protein
MGFTAIDATFKLAGQAVSSAERDPPIIRRCITPRTKGRTLRIASRSKGLGEDALAQSLSTARIDLNPHQVDVALFALSSPLSKGALLAAKVLAFLKGY